MQRVTKYPLLLARLYKVTPERHLEARQTLNEARHKIQLHLEHINSVSILSQPHTHLDLLHGCALYFRVLTVRALPAVGQGHQFHETVAEDLRDQRQTAG